MLIADKTASSCTEPLHSTSTLMRDSRRVRAGTATPLRRRNEPVSNEERAIALDDDALMQAARHRAEVKIEYARGQRDGYAKGAASACSAHFWSGTVFGCMMGSAAVYFALRLGWAL